jgi:hypothetical protein
MTSPLSIKIAISYPGILLIALKAIHIRGNLHHTCGLSRHFPDLCK